MRRNNNFDFIRFFAAASIILSHSFALTMGSSTAEPLFTITRGLSLGCISVFTFFIMSGFLITKSLALKPIYPHIPEKSISEDISRPGDINCDDSFFNRATKYQSELARVFQQPRYMAVPGRYHHLWHTLLPARGI